MGFSLFSGLRSAAYRVPGFAKPQPPRTSATPMARPMRSFAKAPSTPSLFGKPFAAVTYVKSLDQASGRAFLRGMSSVAMKAGELAVRKPKP